MFRLGSSTGYVAISGRKVESTSLFSLFALSVDIAYVSQMSTGY